MDELMVERLRDIVAQENLDEEAVRIWAGEILLHYDRMVFQNKFDKKADEAKLQDLVRQVRRYNHDPSIPPLPAIPDGSVQGIGFIYDKFRNERVMLAIDQLKYYQDVIAVAQHDNKIDIYTCSLLFIHEMYVCADQWQVTEYLPLWGRWVKADQEFMRQCVSYMLSRKKRPD